MMMIDRPRDSLSTWHEYKLVSTAALAMANYLHNYLAFDSPKAGAMFETFKWLGE
jgi:hypothetical protein